MTHFVRLMHLDGPPHAGRVELVAILCLDAARLRASYRFLRLCGVPADRARRAVLGQVTA